MRELQCRIHKLIFLMEVPSASVVCVGFVAVYTVQALDDIFSCFFRLSDEDPSGYIADEKSGIT